LTISSFEGGYRHKCKPRPGGKKSNPRDSVSGAIVASMVSALPKVSILGIGVDAITEDQLNREIVRIVKQGEKELVLNVNVNAFNQALFHTVMTDLLGRAGIVYCDGYGVILGARLLGARIPARITCADWMWSLAAVCEREAISLFFLGAREGIAVEAARKLRAVYPALPIVGVRNGYFEKAGPENDVVIDEINRARPDILVLGLGVPAQEYWLAENWRRVDAHVALSGGACFDFVSGTVPRAPRWMADNGLEWLFRLALEPRRMFLRYAVGNPLFVLRVLRQRITKGKSPQFIDSKTALSRSRK
jgi:N-acetylglucosaminyldiphosphoundecaprenol N-acetyl-beta-D-mannosaminyltransferase